MASVFGLLLLGPTVGWALYQSRAGKAALDAIARPLGGALGLVLGASGRSADVLHVSPVVRTSSRVACSPGLRSWARSHPAGLAHELGVRVLRTVALPE